MTTSNRTVRVEGPRPVGGWFPADRPRPTLYDVYDGRVRVKSYRTREAAERHARKIGGAS